MLSQHHPRCPKCHGRLHQEQDMRSQRRLPAEWACLQCGWRRTYTLLALERRFAITVLDEDRVPDGVGVPPVLV